MNLLMKRSVLSTRKYVEIFVNILLTKGENYWGFLLPLLDFYDHIGFFWGLKDIKDNRKALLKISGAFRKRINVINQGKN